jgi:hypothetical protein
LLQDCRGIESVPRLLAHHFQVWAQMRGGTATLEAAMIGLAWRADEISAQEMH